MSNSNISYDLETNFQANMESRIQTVKDISIEHINLKTLPEVP